MFGIKKKDKLEKKKKEEESANMIIHEEPLICMFDLDKEIHKSFSDKSFNCTSGSIAANVRVPNDQRHHEHLLKLNYEVPKNLHEYDILIFDMGTDNIVDYDSENIHFGNLTGQAAYSLLSLYPEKIFNPKPFSTKIISESINKILEKESIIIIFADKKEIVNYQCVETTSRGNRITDQITHSNTSFYREFPHCENKAGRKIKIIEKNKLTSTLLKYSVDSHYEIIFQHPMRWEDNNQVKENNFIPLALNNDDEIVSFCHNSNKGIVFVFPQVNNKKDFLLELFTNHLPDIFPKLFPYQGQFNWLDNHEYLTPAEIKIISQKEEIEKKYLKDIELNRLELIKTKEEYTFLKNILSETGESLVRSIEFYLNWLEFESVVNLDETNPDVLEEDLQVDCGDKFLVIEVKGIGGTSSDKDCSQISKIRTRRMEERQKFDVFGLYIVNHQRYIPPKSRSNPPFSANQIKDSELDKRGLLTTYELYQAYFMVEDGLLKKEDIRDKFFETGVITLHPSNLKSVDTPQEYYENGKVAILNIDNQLLKKGDCLVAKKGNDYTKLIIKSIKIDNQDAEEVSSGEIGIKFDKQVKKGSELFMFDI